MTPLLLDVEMAAIDPAGLQRLDDVARVFVGARRDVDRALRLFEEVRDSRSRTSCGSRYIAKIAAGLAVDPVGHVDPSARSRPGASGTRADIPKVPVALGRIDAEPRSTSMRTFSCLRIDRMALEGGEQFVACRSGRPFRRTSMYQVW